MINTLKTGLKPRLPNLKMSQSSLIFAVCFSAWLGTAVFASTAGEIKISFAFRKGRTVDGQMALTPDSVGVLAIDSTAGSLEPDDENGFANALKKRALFGSERDSAATLLTLTSMWKGLKRFTCDRDDGYAFSIWSDSLALHCNNCFSCRDGMTMQEAKTLAKFGKLTLWLSQLRDSMLKDKSAPR